VPGCFNVRVVTARSLSVVTAIAVTSIALTAAPIWRDPPRCTGQPNATVQRAVASTIMQIDSVDSERVKEKKHKK